MSMEREPSAWAAGWTAFAGFMMIMVGVFHGIVALGAIFNDETFVLTQDYVFKFDSTTWGWIHLIWALVVLFAGFGVFSGAVWARTVGVIVALLSAIANFAYLPYYPVWAILIIAVDVAVIWALTVRGRDVTEMRSM